MKSEKLTQDFFSGNRDKISRGLIPDSVAIMTSNDESGISYQAVFSNWRVNPKLSDIMFEFEPSDNYTREKLQIKK